MHSNHSRSDADLLQGFSGSGNTADFESLVTRHAQMVHAVAMRTLSNHHDAEDVTQAVFLALAREAAKLTGKPSVAGWLHTVSRRLSLDVRRSRESRQRREQAMIPESENTGPIDDLIPSFRRELDFAINRLPDRYRQPLVLFYMEGAPHAEVAQRLNLEPSTLRTRLSRACDMLRGMLVRRGVEVTSVGILTTLLASEAKAATAAFTPTLLSAVINTGLSGANYPSHILKLSGKAAGASSAVISSSISTLMMLMNGKAVLISAGAVALLALGIYRVTNHEADPKTVGNAAELQSGLTEDPLTARANSSSRRTNTGKQKFESIDAAEKALIGFDMSPIFKGASKEEGQRCVDSLRMLVASIPESYYSELASRLGKGAENNLKRSGLFRAIYQEWGRNDLEAALADLCHSEIEDERTFHKTLESVLTGAAETDVTKAMKLAETIEVEPDRINEVTRFHLMDVIFDQWITTDPYEALSWAQQASVPQTQRDQWINDGLRDWSKQDPDAADRWRKQASAQELIPSDSPSK